MKVQTFFLFALVQGVALLPGFAQTQGNPQFPDFRITMSRSQFKSVLDTSGQKVVLKNPSLIINQDTVAVKELHTRGNNSLRFEHKSFSVELKNSTSIHLDGKKVKIKEFDLLNLVMDKNLWHNRWAMLGLSGLGIFPLINTYCTLTINNQPQGIYLLVEKPNNLVAKEKSPYMLRRGINHSIDDEYMDKGAKDESKKYKQQFLSLYTDIGKYTNEDLYNRLQSKLDLEHYFTWLAFNYLIMNGDYSDELFLFIQPGTGRFDVLPWDYDDILRPPHEGNKARYAVPGIEEKLIYSIEDPLDRAIATDEYLYRQYLSSFKKLLALLPPELLSANSEKVLRELVVLSENQEAAKASLFLGRESFQIDKAKEEVRLGLEFFHQRRNGLLTKMQ